MSTLPEPPKPSKSKKKKEKKTPKKEEPKTKKEIVATETETVKEMVNAVPLTDDEAVIESMQALASNGKHTPLTSMLGHHRCESHTFPLKS